MKKLSRFEACGSLQTEGIINFINCKILLDIRIYMDYNEEK